MHERHAYHLHIKYYYVQEVGSIPNFIRGVSTCPIIVIVSNSLGSVRRSMQMWFFGGCGVDFTTRFPSFSLDCIMASAQSQLKWGGVRVAFGGFVMHLALGTMYTFGNATSYLTSHLRKYDPSITYQHMLLVFALQIVGQATTMFLGGEW